MSGTVRQTNFNDDETQLACFIHVAASFIVCIQLITPCNRILVLIMFLYNKKTIYSTHITYVDTQNIQNTVFIKKRIPIQVLFL